MRRTSAETREHILRVAGDLFYWQGIRATGVDKVAAEAGVAPTTLYRLFAAKDDLVAAYVERTAADYRSWVERAVADDGRTPEQRILALFDALAVQVRPGNCRGCTFLMALAETPDPGQRAAEAAREAKAWTRDRIRSLTRLTDAAAPDLLADHLALVMEGVYASVQALGVEGPASSARTLAELLLEKA